MKNIKKIVPLLLAFLLVTCLSVLRECRKNSILKPDKTEIKAAKKEVKKLENSIKVIDIKIAKNYENIDSLNRVKLQRLNAIQSATGQPLQQGIDTLFNF